MIQFLPCVSKAQMDIDYTFAQMLYLCISPRSCLLWLHMAAVCLYSCRKVYQLTSYRKQTKNQWVRALCPKPSHSVGNSMVHAGEG